MALDLWSIPVNEWLIGASEEGAGGWTKSEWEAWLAAWPEGDAGGWTKSEWDEWHEWWKLPCEEKMELVRLYALDAWRGYQAFGHAVNTSPTEITSAIEPQMREGGDGTEEWISVCIEFT